MINLKAEKQMMLISYKGNISDRHWRNLSLKEFLQIISYLEYVATSMCDIVHRHYRFHFGPWLHIPDLLISVISNFRFPLHHSGFMAIVREDWINTTDISPDQVELRVSIMFLLLENWAKFRSLFYWILRFLMFYMIGLICKLMLCNKIQMHRVPYKSVR
jgi:hypothetical protein